MKRRLIRATVVLAALGTVVGAQPRAGVDLLIVGGKVLDGAGNPWVQEDIGITGDTITFVGHARAAGVTAAETVAANGLLVTPGFWDVHSHADFMTPETRQARPQLYQGITTLLLGIDGGGTNNIAEIFDGYRKNGMAVNALRYVGQGAARGAVMGVAEREPTAPEMEKMKAYVAKGMEEGAIGLSTGLFYSPGFFAKTNEVIELDKVAARYGGVYDTHDRDLGVAYRGIGYLNSIREAIEIGEQGGTPVIFSHFNAQGVKNYGRAPEGAKLVDEARARGVNVMAGQHVYTSTSSGLVAYALPRWAVVGGNEEMKKRFKDPATRERLTKEITEMLEVRGGAEKIVFSDEKLDLNGRSLADKAKEWNLSVPDTVMRILNDGPAGVMNRELYDPNNTEFLAKQEWMMTCTDGNTPTFGKGIINPRIYGTFSKKLREYVYEKHLISLPFAVRGMTSLASTFFGIHNRGLIKEGQKADIAIFDEAKIRDKATYENPHQYSEGTVHVIVNGKFAFRDGKPTGVLAGQPIPRPSRPATSTTSFN